MFLTLLKKCWSFLEELTAYGPRFLRGVSLRCLRRVASGFLREVPICTMVRVIAMDTLFLLFCHRLCYPVRNVGPGTYFDSCSVLLVQDAPRRCLLPRFFFLSQVHCLNLKQGGLSGDPEGLVFLLVHRPYRWIFEEEMVTNFFAHLVTFCFLCWIMLETAGLSSGALTFGYPLTAVAFASFPFSLTLFPYR